MLVEQPFTPGLVEILGLGETQGPQHQFDPTRESRRTDLSVCYTREVDGLPRDPVS